MRAQAPEAPPLMVWGVLGGIEVAPIDGELSLGGWRGRVDAFVLGHVGLGSFRIMLKPENVRLDGTASPATFGDLGLRLVVGLGVSVRVHLARNAWLRFELLDEVHARRLVRLNGCDVGDLRLLDNALRGGYSPSTAAREVSATCRVAAFTGDHPNSGAPPLKRENDVGLALNELRGQRNSWVHLVTAQLGFAVGF